MPEPGPTGPLNPFEGMPLFGDLARLFASQGPLNWDLARQVAVWVATEGQPEDNVDPLERVRLEELARVAELHVAEHTGLPTAVAGGMLAVTPVTRSTWALRALQDHRDLLERLATSLAVPGDPDEGTAPDAGTELLGGIAQLLAPVLLGMQAGFMAGHLSRRSLGQYDVLLPRPPSDELLVVPANVDEFADRWALPVDDLRLWVCLREITHHAVLGRPHVHERLRDLVGRYVSSFEVDSGGVEARLGEIDPTDIESFQSVLGDPEALLGAIQSDAQRALLPRIGALTAAVTGYVDHVMGSVGRRLIGSYDQLVEAFRRHLVEESPGDTYVARLFGLQPDQAHYDRATAFAEGVVERAGERALDRLWSSERELPTAAEIEAPGLWLARIDLPAD